MEITYLYHSGFAVETERHFLVFDYWRDTPKNGKLKDGVIDPMEIREKDVLVFASHRHRDHYNKVILEWPEAIPRCRIFLSDDIDVAKGAVMLAPDEELAGGDFELKTLRSNDEGVAFLLRIDSKLIYHAGDLNWWHWQGEPGSWNEDIKASYQREIGLLANEKVDLAFVPVDPRLKDQYAWGIDHFMRTVETRRVVPMHFGSKARVVERLMGDEAAKPYANRIIAMTTRGMRVEVD